MPSPELGGEHATARVHHASRRCWRSARNYRIASRGGFPLPPRIPTFHARPRTRRSTAASPIRSEFITLLGGAGGAPAIIALPVVADFPSLHEFRRFMRDQGLAVPLRRVLSDLSSSRFSAVLAERPQLSHCQSWRISPPSTNSDVSCATKDSPFHCGESYRP